MPVPAQDDASAQASPNANFTFIQRAAGEPGADGWTAAQSAACGFRVELPARYNETRSAIEDGGVFHTLGVHAEACRVVVICHGRDSEDYEPDYVDAVVQSIVGDNRRARVSTTTMAGCEAARVETLIGQSVQVQQALLTDRHAYRAIVECPVAAEKRLSAIEARVFRSFELADDESCRGRSTPNRAESPGPAGEG